MNRWPWDDQRDSAKLKKRIAELEAQVARFRAFVEGLAWSVFSDDWDDAAREHLHDGDLLRSIGEVRFGQDRETFVDPSKETQG